MNTNRKNKISTNILLRGNSRTRRTDGKFGLKGNDVRAYPRVLTQPIEYHAGRCHGIIVSDSAQAIQHRIVDFNIRKNIWIVRTFHFLQKTLGVKQFAVPNEQIDYSLVNVAVCLAMVLTIPVVTFQFFKILKCPIHWSGICEVTAPS
jgi:hypothetical protein